MERLFLMFLDHTQRRSTHDTHHRQISMPPVGFEPTISTGELITHPEESYRLCCVVLCDLETSRIGAPYIYMTLVA